jgi:hypothetical protein
MMVVALGSASAAFGQDADNSQAPATNQQPAPGQFTIERVESGWVIAPDVRFTEVNKRTATLAGVYGGWMLEHTVMFGGGVSWIANQSHDFEMVYGGPMVEWLMHGERPISFGVRGLVGGGSATIGGTYGDLFGVPNGGPADVGRDGRHVDHPGGTRPSVSTHVIAREDFFVAEPQALVSFRTARWMRIYAGVGYRFTAGSDFDDRLSGVSGMISIAFGGGGS